MNWIDINIQKPLEGQIVDIWEMPDTETLKRNLSLKGSSYAKQYHVEADYSGWRNTNYKFSIEKDDKEAIHCFTKCYPKYFHIPGGGIEYRKLCVENGEVIYWMPIPESPDKNKT